MNLRLLCFLCLLLPGVATGQAIDFPHPPAGQVLDAGGWLGEERRSRLEEELGRYRASHALDVLVVLWDRGLPPETTLEGLARRVGETWARHDLWAVVLHVPDSLLRPVVVFGGRASTHYEDEDAGLALHNAVSRGMKERSTRAQVEALGLELGEEFVFLKNRAAHERKQVMVIHDQQHLVKKERHQSMIFRAFITTMLTLLAVGVVAVIHLIKRRPSDLRFPETQWRRRLGATWSGGSRIVVSLPSRIS